MKKAINAWSVPAGISFETMFLQIAAAGFDGVELNLDADDSSSHSLTMDTSAAQLARIRELAEASGLRICSVSTSLYGSNPLGARDPAVRERGKRIVRRQLELASALGADGILVVPGGLDQDTTLLQARETAFAALSSLSSDITASKILVGLENVWNGFFMSPFDMASLLDALDCPYIGAYFDVGNVAVHSEPDHWIEILGNRIVKVHIKDFLRSHGIYSGWFVNLLEGSIRWDKVMASLRAAGYDGYLTAEVSAMPHCPTHLYRITSSAMDILLQAV